MFLHRIPGFRSGQKWKMVLAILLYLFMILIIISSFFGVTLGDKIINDVRSIVLLSFLYIMITNIANIRGRLPLLRKQNRTFIKLVTGIIVYSIVGFLLLTMVFVITDDFFSPEQKAIDSVQRKQREIEAKLKKESEECEQAPKKEVDLKGTVAKGVEESKKKENILTELDAKNNKSIEESKNDKNMVVEGLTKETKQKVQSNANSPEAEKSQYIFVGYGELARYPKRYIGMNIVNRGRVLTADADGKIMTCVVEVSPNSLMLVTIPQSSLDINVMEDDYIDFYGQYKGVTSEITQRNLLFLGYEEKKVSYNKVMPYIKAKYVNVLTR